MKKAIIIYLIGVVLSLGLSFKIVTNWTKEFKRPLTYGDVGMCLTLSIFSWLNVGAATLFLITESDIWDKPINNKEVIL